MNFVSVRLITPDIKRSVAFYQAVLGLSPTWYTDDFAEFTTAKSTLAIGSTNTMKAFGAEAPKPGGGAIIEFHVDDVDRTFEAVEKSLTSLLQKPTTMPWGNRSLLFRDPDGNLVNFFTPVTPQAIAKFKGERAPAPA